MHKSQTKRALLTSVLALVLCVAMFASSTYAWFTDTASTGINKITSGNLDVELKYSKDLENWADAEKATDIFSANKWEPGYTEVVYFKVTNAGSLAFKYYVTTKIEAETAGVNQKGESFKLSDYLQFGIVETTEAFADRDAARAAITAPSKFGAIQTAEASLTAEENANSATFAMVVWMPEETGDAANHNGTNIPEIQFGVSVVAHQAVAEKDSYDNEYDAKAPQLVSLNGENYDTLESAVAAAKDGDTIKIQGNHTMPAVSNKTITISGIGNKADSALTLGNVNASGSTIAFENITVIGHGGDDTWYTHQLDHGTKATYTNCTIVNLITTYTASDFTKCEFVNTSTADADWYSVFVYGNDCNITDCTFNTTASKAVKLYSEGAQGATLNVSDCTFNGSFFDKAAVEVDSTHTTVGYTVNITNCTTNEYYNLLVTDKAAAPKSTITVDDISVVIVKDNTDLHAAINAADTTAPVMVVLPAGTFNPFDKYTGELSAVGKNITFAGSKDTVIDFTNIQWAYMQILRDATLTFDGVTVNWKRQNEGYQGLANAKKVIYQDCHITGTQFMYGDADFIDCTFETQNGYNVYGRGVGTLNFSDCSFDNGGRAIMLYADQPTDVKVNLTNCTFSGNGTDKTDKAVVETGESSPAGSKFDITITNCTQTGFVANNSTSPLWGNKNSMPTDRLSVVIDGTKAY